MTIDLTDTTTGAIDQALTEARRRLGGMTLGMVLTLIIVTDEAAQYDAIRAANQAAREHPCRILAVITRKPKGDSRLDAEIRVGESSPEAYERLILDVLIGDPPLFPRQEEVELSWRILDPIEDFWAENTKPEQYASGGAGPASADAMMARDGRAWRRL